MTKRKSLIILGITLFFILIIYFLSSHLNMGTRLSVKATSANAIISSQADWQAGERVNIDSTTTAGSIKMDTKSAVKQDLTGVSGTSVNVASGSANDTLNPSCASQNRIVFGGSDVPGDKSFTLDLGEIKSAVYYELNFLNFGAETKFYVSDDGSSWSEISISQVEGSACSGPVVKSPFFTGRYVKFFSPADINPSCNWGSFNLFKQSSTEKVTVDGGTDFWSWDSNSITQTVPANTTATYRYRTSTNGSDWTSWVGSIASVTSRTGDDDNNPTRYRYLQIEATLTNTDGVSTPTIDSYDIDYHTEVKPAAPSAQTAVVQ